MVGRSDAIMAAADDDDAAVDEDDDAKADDTKEEPLGGRGDDAPLRNPELSEAILADRGDAARNKADDDWLAAEGG
jgi:hypothetical protein